MHRTPIAVIGLLAVPLALLLGAGCESDSSDDGRAGPSTTRAASSTTLPPVGGPTELTVTGVRTVATVDPTATPEEVPFAGTLRCDDDRATGTGDFAETATQLCARVIEERALFTTAPDPGGRICTEIYGGPQHATIKGSVDGERVNREITRSDGCGISDWTELEWLLGPPEA